MTLGEMMSISSTKVAVEFSELDLFPMLMLVGSLSALEAAEATWACMAFQCGSCDMWRG